MGTRLIYAEYYLPGDAAEEAVAAIRRGGVVVGVTDTLYGLFTSPFNASLVEKVYRVKERTGKPLPLLADRVETVVRYTGEKRLEAFMRAVWPGPVTLILPVPRNTPIAANAHLETWRVGFRVPAAPLPRMIAERLGGLVTGTSANISGQRPPRTAMEALKQLGERVDLYIDSGPAPIGVGSTVVAIDGDELTVVRRGAVDPLIIERLYRLLAER